MKKIMQFSLLSYTFMSVFTSVAMQAPTDEQFNATMKEKLLAQNLQAHIELCRKLCKKPIGYTAYRKALFLHLGI